MSRLCWQKHGVVQFRQEEIAMTTKNEYSFMCVYADGDWMVGWGVLPRWDRIQVAKWNGAWPNWNVWAGACRLIFKKTDRRPATTYSDCEWRGSARGGKETFDVGGNGDSYKDSSQEEPVGNIGHWSKNFFPLYFLVIRVTLFSHRNAFHHIVVKASLTEFHASSSSLLF